MSDVRDIIRQAIRNSHDATYRFPEDVEAHVERVASLIANEGKLSRPKTNSAVAPSEGAPASALDDAEGKG